MSKAEVLSILAKPNDVQTMNSEGYKSERWYYGGFGDWQLCFDNGLTSDHLMWLSSKNNY